MSSINGHTISFLIVIIIVIIVAFAVVILMVLHDIFFSADDVMSISTIPNTNICTFCMRDNCNLL